MTKHEIIELFKDRVRILKVRYDYALEHYKEDDPIVLKRMAAYNDMKWLLNDILQREENDEKHSNN